MLQLRKYILLLASVVAMVTYAAGFSPPGGVWKDTAAGHVAGDSVLRDTHYNRYLVFFYFNATAFAASLLAIILVLIVAYLDDKDKYSNSRIICQYRKNRWIAVQPLQAIMVLDLLSLMGAYAATTYQQDTFATVYSLLLLSFVFIYHVAMMAMASCFTESSGVLEAKEAELLKEEERFRKVLMVLATFAVSTTYKAGLSTTGGILDTTKEGHRNTRLTVLFVFNTTAFIASLFIIMVFLDRKLRKKNAYGFIIVNLVSLVGAYIAGSCRQAGTTIYMVVLVAGVLAYILFLSIRRAKKNHAPEYRPTENEKAAYKVRSLVMLLATLVVTITYQAGLDPPGGTWQDNKDGNMAGDPILLTVNARRYKAFFYCNTVAFLASLQAIFLVQKMRELRHHLLNAVMVLSLLGLLGAYVAGISRDLRSFTLPMVMAVAAVLIIYIATHVLLFKQLDQRYNIKRDDELVENMRKRLLLFAILLATMTYKAGISPPGGFLLLQDNQPGYHAGDAVLSYNFPRRYKAFFLCNSVSFVLSIALNMVLVNPIQYRLAIRRHALSVCTAAGLFGLVGAYAAGSTQHLKTSIYILALSAVVLFFVPIPFMAYGFTGGSTHVMVTTMSNNTTQEAATETNRRDNKATKKKRIHAKRKCLILLGILAAAVTYQAGLEPPGGAWQSSSGDYEAGNPIMHDNRRTRYLTFFYMNSTSFMASIVVILLQLVPKKLFGRYHYQHTYATWQMIVLDLLGLLGAYAAGSTRAIKTSVYVILLFMIAVVASSGIQFVL
ncbi:uncharacterized protein [Setaria viridis]|uniref:uncharacterized protein n=1 Tax=Setaria viridis TaxID=4556 RepID=UPI0014932F49|nr:uncharacterized protein LOC117834669 [Setaria viridis]